MALTFLKPSVVTVTPVTAPPVQTVLVEAPPVLTEVAALAQEYLLLHQKWEAADGKNLTKRMEEIKKSLCAYANEHLDAKKPAVFQCPEGEVEFSERGDQAEVKNVQALISYLAGKFGIDVAMSVVNVAITPLRKMLTEYELLDHLDKKPGSRTLKSVRPK